MDDGAGQRSESGNFSFTLILYMSSTVQNFLKMKHEYSSL